MDGNSLPNWGPEQRLVQYLQARFDVPAYVRRAQQVQESLDRLLARCRTQQQRWLKEGKMVLEDLAALVSSWDDLSPWLPSEVEREALANLSTVLVARVVFRPHPAPARRLRRTLMQLREWLEAFNRRWDAYLSRINLGPVNEVRDGYNRYYLLEKECALRSARLAWKGFQPLQPLTIAELLRHFPLLPVIGAL